MEFIQQISRVSHIFAARLSMILIFEFSMLALAFIGLSAIGTATTMILNKCLVVKGSDNRLYRVVRSFSVVDNHRRLFSQYKDRLWSCECINMAFILWYNMSITYGGMVMAGLVGARKLFNSYAIDAATDPEYWWLRTTAHRDSIFMLRSVCKSSSCFINLVYQWRDSSLRLLWQEECPNRTHKLYKICPGKVLPVLAQDDCAHYALRDTYHDRRRTQFQQPKKYKHLFNQLLEEYLILPQLR